MVLPFAVLLWSSLQKFYSVPSWEALYRLTLDSYRIILEYPQFWTRGMQQPHTVVRHRDDHDAASAR